ncbi:MAG TPA: amino acid permease [Actinomycetes bacterium]
MADSVDDRLLERFGYQQQYTRTLKRFESFAIGFSFISITTGIFTTFGFVLNTSGPKGIWTWPIVIVGQTLVAMVYAALAAKIPLAGYSYQWASRLVNPSLGWAFGWMSFAFLTIVTVSVDYAFVQVAFQPLLGLTYTPLSAALLTLAVLAAQALLIIYSTPIVTRINNLAVGTEVIGLIGLTVVLLLAALFLAKFRHFGNLGSTGIVPAAGWWGWLGPFMLATLLGAYTIVGFESASNLSEETHEPRKVVPNAMVRSVWLSGIIGMVFLIGITSVIRDLPAASGEAAPVAFIMKDVLGGFFEKLFLLFICVSIFACGMVIMVTNSRLTWSMARDRRLPGHQALKSVPRPTGGPLGATVLVAVLSGVIVLVLRNNTDALFKLFTASTLMPAILYAGTVLLYVFTAHRVQHETGYFSLGRWEWPVIVGALVWLAYELTVLIGPSDFRGAQGYALLAVGLGVVVFGLMWLLEPAAMRREAGVTGLEALEAGEGPATPEAAPAPPPMGEAATPESPA